MNYLPLEVDDPFGRPMKWRPFSVAYDSPDGEFEFIIMAISHEHAVLQVDAIKETARVVGQIVGVYGNRNNDDRGEGDH